MRKDSSHENKCLVFSSIIWKVSRKDKKKVNVFCLHEALLVKHKPLDSLSVFCGVPDIWGDLHKVMWFQHAVFFHIKVFFSLIIAFVG